MSDRGFAPASIPGIIVFQRTLLEDNRGFLSRLYSADCFEAAGIRKPVVQINHTLTRQKGVVRGLHFQWPPHAETKLVTCLRGEVFDVALDLRKDSATFLKWHAEVISSANHRSLLIPEGFAHGFQTLTPDCELVYLHTSLYTPEAQGVVNALDPRAQIRWPLEITQMSDRDRTERFLAEEFEGIEL